MTTPRYQDIKGKDITEITDDDGTHIRIIAGDYRGYKGPVDGIAAEPQYLDVTLPPRAPINAFRLTPAGKALPISLKVAHVSKMRHRPLGLRLKKNSTVRSWKYVICQAIVRSWCLMLAMRSLQFHQSNHRVRFLLISGGPLREPVAWHGPIVMNTREELHTAMRELNNGTFIKTGAAGW